MIVVIDASAPLPAGYRPARRQRRLIAANKSDLPPSAATLACIERWDAPVIRTSGATGAGVSDLAEAVLALLGIPVAPVDAALRPTVFTEGQAAAVSFALDCLRRGDPAAARLALDRLLA